MKRRTFIKLASLGAIGATGFYYYPDEGILNPCEGLSLPEDLLQHDVVQSAWSGVDATLFRDVHTHLIGTGDSGSGIFLHPSMQDVLSPLQFVRYKFYLNASCSEHIEGVDNGYVYSLKRLMNDFPTGAKCMLLAFDYHYESDGTRNIDKTPFHIPNAYTQTMANAYQERFEWIASIHPYRKDCVPALLSAIQNGAKAVKWLPPVMGIDPSSELCDPFYATMANYDIPLITHAGDEHAVDGVDAQAKGNPLLLRRALDHGVRVIVAHCASDGIGIDLDQGLNGPRVPNFDLFTRMMEEKKYEGLLFGEISAMTQLNRIGPALQMVLSRDDWQHRLLNGSDYPLPGVMPLGSTKQFYRLGYLDSDVVEPLRMIRRYNPILYDFLLKRTLQWQGKKFANQVFESKVFFEKNKKIMLG